jgi:hypothetical protein
MAALATQPPLAETMASHQATSEPSEDFGWTCGNDRELKHLKKLNIGAYSEVHQVYLYFLLQNV